MRLIVAITGASGVVYGKRLLEILREKKVETYLIVSKAAESVIEHELETTKRELEKLASHVYDVNDLSAPIVSGSFKTDGMIVIPCSMKTLAGITHGYSRQPHFESSRRNVKGETQADFGATRNSVKRGSSEEHAGFGKSRRVYSARHARLLS